MTKIPTWFYLIAGVALLWNLVGAGAVIMNFMITPETLLSLPPEQQQLYAKTPMWSSYASLLAVVAGTLGSLSLLFKKAWAYPLFILSIVGLVVQDIAIFIVVDALEILGAPVLIMQGFVGLIAIALLFLAKYAISQQWIK